MFSNNPYLALSADIPSNAIRLVIILMVALVIVGTLFDVIHKKSAKYFFASWRKSSDKAGVGGAADTSIRGGEVAAMAVKTLAVEVATSAEFCNPHRRIAHLLTMYGFIAHAAATVAMGVSASESSLWPVLWHLGALSVCLGGYWFWFFIRANVAAEGDSPFTVIRADLFILSLLATTTFALLWSWTQGSGIGWLFFALYVLSSAVLFGGVPWSKFAHMFFKPAAALEKRVGEASGTRNNLPPPVDKPATMGLGIKRELPRHY